MADTTGANADTHSGFRIKKSFNHHQTTRIASRHMNTAIKNGLFFKCIINNQR